MGQTGARQRKMPGLIASSRDSRWAHSSWQPSRLQKPWVTLSGHPWLGCGSIWVGGETRGRKEGDERSIKRKALQDLQRKAWLEEYQGLDVCFAFPLGSRVTDLSPLTLPLYPQDCLPSLGNKSFLCLYHRPSLGLEGLGSLWSTFEL